VKITPSILSFGTHVVESSFKSGYKVNYYNNRNQYMVCNVRRICNVYIVNIKVRIKTYLCPNNFDFFIHCNNLRCLSFICNPFTLRVQKLIILLDIIICFIEEQSDYQCFCSHGNNSSRGVAILIRNQLDYEIISQ
jgi:hypothetical protein